MSPAAVSPAAVSPAAVSPANVEIIRGGYDAFATGDIPAVLQMLAEDVTWHVPGTSPLSGDFKGHDGMLTFFALCQELSGGTLDIRVDEMLADGERVIALTTVSAERNGRSWSSPEVHVWRVEAGRAVEFCEYQGDQETESEFWST